MSSSSILSQTLQSITTIKIRELRKQRVSFQSRKSKVLQAAENAIDVQARVRVLLNGVSEVEPSEVVEKSGDSVDLDTNNKVTESSLKNIHRYVVQSRYDPSVPPSLLQTFEHDLRHKLDQRQKKYDYADLYARLLTEWLSSDGPNVGDAPTTEDTSLDGSFELVEKDRLRQLREKFESVVFAPLNTDEIEIDNYLSGYFPGEVGTKALRDLRKRTEDFGDNLVTTVEPFNDYVLDWCIRGLQKNDLLSDRKKALLADFLKNDDVLTEIADVLNMRFADLNGWSWDAEDGMPVEPRRQLNGKYRVMMDEDILQAIFFHYIAIVWSVEVKDICKTFVVSSRVWKRPQNLSSEDKC